ncbi:TRAP transporter TatT component family protein [Paraliomyxa miuraensis]|uniref:TRAP transporter TatT component family protein n=1 Tax=Paraliomyxa miuraensis TaxID=376150 RepID=UPI002253DE36|nr:TRAP transporter TatT component family protein [Paraliomyxa miuraensis]MCX4247313.1 TRAP transporter TatT component family protein [Paraliomyxa miuraensis]
MFEKRVALVMTMAILLPGGCAGRKAVWKDGEGDTTTQATVDVAALVAKGDESWGKRSDPQAIRTALAEWEKAANADPKNLDVLVKLTRGYYFLADGYLRDKDKEYLDTMDKAVKWGEKAMVAASPEFDAKMRDGGKIPDAVKVVPKEGVPAMYWYASALGKWAKKKGFAVLLGQKDNVKATMDRCLELEPDYFYGGPHRYFGAFYAVAPAFAGGDLEKSKVHFNKSLEIAPSYVGTKVLWAAELSTKEQDEDTFEKLLNEVLAAPDDSIPELRPEIMVEKAKAKELLAQQGDLF